MKWGERNNRWKKGIVMLLATCATSIITGVHFSEVSVEGGTLSRVVGAVETAMTDCVKITAV